MQPGRPLKRSPAKQPPPARPEAASLSALCKRQDGAAEPPVGTQRAGQAARCGAREAAAAPSFLPSGSETRLSARSRGKQRAAPRPRGRSRGTQRGAKGKRGAASLPTEGDARWTPAGPALVPPAPPSPAPEGPRAGGAAAGPVPGSPPAGGRSGGGPERGRVPDAALAPHLRGAGGAPPPPPLSGRAATGQERAAPFGRAGRGRSCDSGNSPLPGGRGTRGGSFQCAGRREGPAPESPCLSWALSQPCAGAPSRLLWRLLLGGTQRRPQRGALRTDRPAARFGARPAGAL